VSKNGKTNKFYFNLNFDDGGPKFTAKQRAGVNLNIRFAGNPKFLLKKMQERNGSEEGLRLYRELMECMQEIANDGYSPLVAYLR
jgi:hypothetical protein